MYENTFCAQEELERKRFGAAELFLKTTETNTFYGIDKERCGPIKPVQLFVIYR